MKDKKRLKASATLEASLVIPILIFVIFTIIGIMLSIGNSMRIRYCIYDGVRKGVGSLVLFKDKNVAEREVLSRVFVQGKVISLLEKENMENKIVGGAYGLSYLDSNFFNEDGSIDLKIEYNNLLFFAPITKKHFKTKERVKAYYFVGEDYIKNKNKSKEQYVYITKTGTTYHTYADCTYLSPKVNECLLSEIANKRNESASKYYKCELCAKNKLENNLCYITAYGNRYHLTSGCKRIKREAKKIKLKDVTSHSECKKCRKRMNGE